MREFLFLTAMLLLVGFVVFISVRYTLHARRRALNTWQGLLSRLYRLNQENIALVALNLIGEDGRVRERDWPELTSEQVWDLVGGMDGLEKIEANCQTFIDIAVYIQHSYPEAVVLAEEFRRNTRHIQWHINRLRAAARTGNMAAGFAEYAQRAVASYYMMGRQVLELCDRTDFAGLNQLREAV